MISCLACKECNYVILLKNAVHLEAELKSCVGMPGVMTANLGSRWLRIPWDCVWVEGPGEALTRVGTLVPFDPKAKAWERKRDVSFFFPQGVPTLNL